MAVDKALISGSMTMLSTQITCGKRYVWLRDD